MSGAPCAPIKKHFWPFMPRRGSYFFLLVQEKANQKERHPAYRPQQKTLGVPCVARHAGRLRNSHVSLREALLEQVLADTPRHGCATRRCTGAPKTIPPKIQSAPVLVRINLAIRAFVAQASCLHAGRMPALHMPIQPRNNLYAGFLLSSQYA